jgi:glycine betaine/proline transport system ATP-binding protein
VAFSDIPVAVTGEQNRLLGVVVKGAVLGGLAGKVNRKTPSDAEEERQVMAGE